MPNDPACQAPPGAPGVRPGSRCGHAVPVSAVPVVVVPVAPVPAPAGLPVLSVSGVRPDAAGDVDVGEVVRAATSGKADLVDGKVPASQLPSYVDDVLEYDSRSAFPETGESGKIYVDRATNAIYRWSGSGFVEVSPSPDWSGELAAKRDKTDLSYAREVVPESYRWLLSVPGGGEAVELLPDPNGVQWSSAGFAVLKNPDYPVWDLYSVVGGAPVAIATQVETDEGAGEIDFGGGYVARHDPSEWSSVSDRLALASEVPAAQVNADWNAESGVARILNKPPIPTVPTPVAPSTAASAQGKPADAKATGDALAGKLNRSEAEEGFTEWNVDSISPRYVFVSCSYSQNTNTWTVNLLYYPLGSTEPVDATEVLLDDADATELVGLHTSLSRTKIRPTKTSELTNDGNGVSPFATVSQIPEISGKADAADLRYRIAEAAYDSQSGVHALSDRTVNLVAAATATDIDISLPAPQAGRSRDFYLAVTCGSTAPTLNAPSGVTLVNAKGEPPDLSLSADATTVLRFTEVKEAGQSTSAVFCVTGGANGGGGSIDPAVLEGLRGKLDLRVYDYAPWSVTLPDSSTVSLAWVDDAGMWMTSDYSYRFGYSDGEWILYHDEGGEEAVIGTVNGDGSELQLEFVDGSDTYTCERDFAEPMSTGDFLAKESQVATKAESEALAPAWISGHAYFKGDHVSYNGLLYECLSTVAGSTDPSADTTHWKLTDLAAPDATLDILSDGRLRVVAADGTPMWTQGYALASESAVALSCEKTNYHSFSAPAAFSASTAYAIGDQVTYTESDVTKVYQFNAAHAAGAWTGTDVDEAPIRQKFALPKAPSGVVGDFVLDISNTAAFEAEVVLDGVLGTDYDVIVEKGRALSDVLSIPAASDGVSALVELYFTMTAFGTAAKPAWRVVRLDVERQEAGS